MSLLVLCLFFIVGVSADEHTHTYLDDEEVILWMGMMQPYYNRQVTYAYYSLPFCVGHGDTVSHYHKSLLEFLQGVDIEPSGLKIIFKEDVPSESYCEILLTEPKQKAFIHAVKSDYWYQMHLDHLSFWDYVGEVELAGNGTNYYLWTHKKLQIGYNGNQIVDVNFTSENKVNLREVERIQFSYEVIWINSSRKFEDRFDEYSDPNYYQLRMHWISIFSIFILVICIAGLISMILIRTLCKNYCCYNKAGQPKLSNIFVTSTPYKKIQQVRMI